ncbi:hypothetical protein H5410_004046 [Solanum commersonii]|uniref:Uncharacterized protein n=1 Tax=Solanum commersonii TaxID=4109 RepID=A0A9J6B6N1_SOLCO|nr:hypothetical protein H5410_004046 [Solanum commersonii]
MEDFQEDGHLTFTYNSFPDHDEAGQIKRDFLCHGCKEIKGYNLVKWEITLNSRDKGGMGIRDLRKQNNSLLMKLLWRYNEEGQALWKMSSDQSMVSTILGAVMLVLMPMGRGLENYEKLMKKLT